MNSVLFHHRLCSVFFVKVIMVSVQNMYQLCHKPPGFLVINRSRYRIFKLNKICCRFPASIVFGGSIGTCTPACTTCLSGCTSGLEVADQSMKFVQVS